MPRSRLAPSRQGTLFVGIDLSKDALEVAGPDLHLKVTNDRAGFVQMLEAVRALKRRTHFACESNRVYGRKLYEFLFAKKCRLSLLSAFKVRQFAKATGRMAKTDYIDAELISEYAATFRPRPSVRPSRTQARLLDTMRRREQLVRVIRDQRLQAPQIWDRELRRSCQDLIARIAQDIRELEDTAGKIVASCPVLAAKHAALCRVPGIASRSATHLLAELPELGSLNRRQVAALAGLAPVNWESGNGTSIRHIRGGRVAVRTAIFMAAHSASKHNPVLSEFFTRLRRRGKPYFVALVAVMRKLLIYLNSLARDAMTTPARPVRPTVFSRKYCKWTPEDEAMLADLVQRKVPVKLMPGMLLRSEHSIRVRLAPSHRRRREENRVAKTAAAG